jgi:chemotaxis protein methyltransferase CheR
MSGNPSSARPRRKPTTRGVPRRATGKTIVPPRTDDCWSTVQRFMQRTCGVVLTTDQSYLADSRLTPVAKQHGYAQISDFVTAAVSSPLSSPLACALIDAMTTHETLFFRDAPFWKTLEDVVLPKLQARALAGAGVRVWSAACSTGQEPYSLAILIAERFPELALRVEIMATDVSELAIARARTGVYAALEVSRGLSAPRLVKHFEQVTGGFRIRSSFRNRITWATHNLLGSKPDPVGCDLVLCRNVLIYFGETDRAAVMRRLIHAAAPGAYIGVGSTETLKEPQVAAGLYVRP